MNKLLALAMLLSTGSLHAAGQQVTLSHDENARTIDVKVEGEPFTVFNDSEELPKPFFSPVRGPGGTVLSRAIGQEKADHPHHKGIWLAVDEVNGVAFWAERGKIKTTSLKILAAEGDPAKFEMVNEWIAGDGQPVVTERTVVSIFANRLIAYDVTFDAAHGPVTFEDTKEGLFGFRMVNSMREQEGGRVVNAEGTQGTKECWGRTSAWIDYSGEVEGKTFGVSLFDHPLNPRPSRYHVRDYGLFSISPFGEQSYTNGKNPADPVIVPAGGTYRLRYALYVHSGDAAAADVAGIYRQYLKASGNGA